MPAPMPNDGLRVLAHQRGGRAHDDRAHRPQRRRSPRRSAAGSAAPAWRRRARAVRRAATSADVRRCSSSAEPSPTTSAAAVKIPAATSDTVSWCRVAVWFSPTLMATTTSTPMMLVATASAAIPSMVRTANGRLAATRRTSSGSPACSVPVTHVPYDAIHTSIVQHRVRGVLSRRASGSPAPQRFAGLVAISRSCRPASRGPRDARQARPATAASSSSVSPAGETAMRGAGVVHVGGTPCRLAAVARDLPTSTA